MPTRSSISIVRVRACALLTVVVDQVGLDDLVADRVVRVQRGERVLEDHRHRRLPRSSRIAGVGDGEQVLAVEQDLAGDLGAWCRRCRPMMAWLVTDLPEPDSPTMPRVWPALELEADAVDRLHQAVVGREVDVQVVDVEERRGREAVVDGTTCRGRTACAGSGRSGQTHSRVDHAVQQVDDQVGHDDEERGDQDQPDDDGQVERTDTASTVARPSPWKLKTVSVIAAPASSAAEVEAGHGDDRASARRAACA